jgi:hypothetical protein
VQLSVGSSDLSVRVGATPKAHLGGEVWLCPLERAVAVAIGRGENRGHTVTYHNVVRGWLKLGDWTGTDSTWTVPMSEIRTDRIDAAAVMLQEGTRDKPGIVLGAAYAPFQSTDGAQQTTANSRGRTTDAR